MNTISRLNGWVRLGVGLVTIFGLLGLYGLVIDPFFDRFDEVTSNAVYVNVAAQTILVLLMAAGVWWIVAGFKKRDH